MDFYQEHLMGMKKNPTIVVQKKQIQTIINTDRILSQEKIKVLDIGCGSGEVVLGLFGKKDKDEESNLEVTGIDVSQKAVDAFTKNTGYSAFLSSATQLPFPDSSFDLIILDDVLEHLENTDLCMIEIHRLLKNKTGFLLMSTPNLAAWFNRILLLGGVQPIFSEVSYLGIFGRPGNDVVGHLRLFTLRALREFLSFHGFETLIHEMATFQSLPRVLKPIDMLFSRSKSLGANHVVLCKKLVAINA